MKTFSDPVSLMRYRDSIYASDLLICSIGHFDLFTNMASRQIDFLSCCRELGIHDRPARVLLSLLLSMNLLEQGEGGLYFISGLAIQSFVSTSPESLAPYFSSLKNRPQCLEFREVLLTDKPAGWSSRKEGGDWLTSMRDPGFADSFTRAMDSRGKFLARELALRIELSGYDSILDIAGGSGVYACAFSEKYPRIRSSVLEITPSDQATRRSLKEKNMDQIVSVIQGDMFQSIPEGYDLHLLAHTLHDWTMVQNRTIVDNSFKSINSGGSIIVFDAHLNEDMNGPLLVAEYSCLLMHSTEGRCYSKKEIRDLLASTGYINVKVIDMPGDRSAIVGTKP
jgi:3-hydroxy-5-methyl-1-naphthoate 3-O-methyltransferase